MKRPLSHGSAAIIYLVAAFLVFGLTHLCTQSDHRLLANSPEALICERDVVFLLDQSTSITEAGPETWPSLRSFALAVAEAIDISPDGVHAGAIKFSTRPEMVVDMTDDKERFVDAVEQTAIRGGSTNTALALIAAVEMLQAHGRPGVVGTIVLISDGQQNQPGNPFNQAQQARERGYELVIVGIGNVDPEFFDTLAGDASPIYCATSDDLQKVIEEVSIDICLGPQPKPTPCDTHTPVPTATVTSTPTAFASVTPAPAPIPTATPTPGRPTAINLDYFRVFSDQAGNYTYMWKTSLQIDTWSFRILVSRSNTPDAPREPVGPEVLAQGGRFGATYTLAVTLPGDVDEQSIFWLEETQIGGEKIVYGPASWVAEPAGNTRLFCPLICR